MSKRDSRQSVLRSLTTIGDWIRFACTRFEQAELCFGHGFERALDEASFLVLSSLELPHDMPPAYIASTILPNERKRILDRIEQRVHKRLPLAYITGQAWFAGLRFKCTAQALVPRSPIAELLQHRLQPWIGEQEPEHILDLCTGGGSIAITAALTFESAQVVGVDISEPALALAIENAELHGVEARVSWLRSNLFEALGGRHFDVILSNPPYVGSSEMASLPEEYRHEPELALASGSDGLDLPLLILVQAADHLRTHGILVLEVGASEEALKAAVPDLPGHWAEFEHGGSGVVVIDAADLRAIRPMLERVLRERNEEL
jgi:ribosomal protein L3 glutamine methyltransferase